LTKDFGVVSGDVVATIRDVIVNTRNHWGLDLEKENPGIGMGDGRGDGLNNLVLFAHAYNPGNKEYKFSDNGTRLGPVTGNRVLPPIFLTEFDEDAIREGLEDRATLLYPGQEMALSQHVMVSTGEATFPAHFDFIDGKGEFKDLSFFSYFKDFLEGGVTVLKTTNSFHVWGNVLSKRVSGPLPEHKSDSFDSAWAMYSNRREGSYLRVTEITKGRIQRLGNLSESEVSKYRYARGPSQFELRVDDLTRLFDEVRDDLANPQPAEIPF